MSRSGLTFVFNRIEVEGQLPVPLIEEHVFRKATQQEAEQIQERLNSYALYSRSMDPETPYRHAVRVEKVEKSPGATSYIHDPLPPEKWRYWVIAHECGNAFIHELQIAAMLLPIDLDFGFTLLYDEPHQQGHIGAMTGMPFHLVEVYSGPGFGLIPPTSVRATDIALIKDYYVRMRALSREASFINDAIRNFYALRSVPGGSSLRAIGYFAIIEALVTHKPRLEESLDSITHQIVNKLLLLSKRFERPLPFSSFPKISREHVWKKLYHYRSRLAHGGRADFKTEFQALGSEFEAMGFLKETVKQLILFGLKDYELLDDLKKC